MTSSFLCGLGLWLGSQELLRVRATRHRALAAGCALERRSGGAPAHATQLAPGRVLGHKGHTLLVWVNIPACCRAGFASVGSSMCWRLSKAPWPVPAVITPVSTLVRLEQRSWCRLLCDNPGARAQVMDSLSHPALLLVDGVSSIGAPGVQVGRVEGGHGGHRLPEGALPAHRPRPGRCQPQGAVAADVSFFGQCTASRFPRSRYAHGLPCVLWLLRPAMVSGSEAGTMHLARCMVPSRGRLVLR